MGIHCQRQLSHHLAHEELHPEWGCLHSFQRLAGKKVVGPTKLYNWVRAQRLNGTYLCPKRPVGFATGRGFDCWSSLGLDDVLTRPGTANGQTSHCRWRWLSGSGRLPDKSSKMSSFSDFFTSWRNPDIQNKPRILAKPRMHV